MTLAIEGWPWCAVCDKPVDVVRRGTEIAACREYFNVCCHGSVERHYLDHEQMAKATSIQIGYAFLDQIEQGS